MSPRPPRNTGCSRHGHSGRTSTDAQHTPASIVILSSSRSSRNGPLRNSAAVPSTTAISVSQSTRSACRPNATHQASGIPTATMRTRDRAAAGSLVTSGAGACGGPGAARPSAAIAVREGGLAALTGTG